VPLPANAEVLRMTDFVESPSDILEDNHFARMVYYRLFLRIREKAAELGRPEAGGAFVRSAR
jgi:hypothetical protein